MTSCRSRSSSTTKTRVMAEFLAPSGPKRAARGCDIHVTEPLTSPPSSSIEGVAPMAVVISIVVIALVFDYINGFHDAANSIATVVSTRVLSPRMAVAWAAFFNFVAFIFFPLHVANTIGKGIIDPQHRRQHRGGVGADRRDRLEPDHLVVRDPVELVARADGRPDRRRHQQGRHQHPRLGEDHPDRGVHHPVADHRDARRRRAAGGGRLDPAALHAGQGRSLVPAAAAGVGGAVQPGARRQRRAEDHGHHRGAAVRERAHRLARSRAVLGRAGLRSWPWAWARCRAAGASCARWG